MKKYTEEELSRILSTADAGLLGLFGMPYNSMRSTYCIEQAAVSSYTSDLHWLALEGASLQRAGAFDLFMRKSRGRRISVDKTMKFLRDNNLL